MCTNYPALAHFVITKLDLQASRGLGQLLLLLLLLPPVVPGPLPVALETVQVEEQYFPAGAAPHSIPAGGQGRAGLW